ncbi:MAG: CopG family transcriptional regulator [Hyperthermus sp.]|nr:MAG: CopG family transcriptional regulator [Hyperthermus sp.]
MSVVIHVRVPRELKRRLDELRVNISEEVRLFLERRIRQLEAERLVRELEELLSSMRKVSDSTRLIREDRDSMAVYR